MNKKLLTMLVSGMFVCSACALAACGSDEYGISVENSGNGSVALSATSAAAGESVTLNVTPDSGYVAGEVRVNGEAVTVENNSAVFTMPGGNVTVTVVFEKQKYALNYTVAKGGAVAASAEAFAWGESVTLNVMPDFGYEFKALTVDGSTATVADGRYTFTMPERDVAVTPVFECVADTTAMPSGSVLTLNATAPAGGTATAELFVALSETAFNITAYVADGKIIPANDGMKFYFGTTEFADGKISAKNLAVEAYLDGTVTALKGTESGAYSALASGVKAEYEPWSEKAGEVKGYILSLAVDYSALGIAADDVGTLTALPYLVNSDIQSLAFGATEVTIDDFMSFGNPDTYPAVSDKGFSDNKYMFGGGSAGSYKNIVEQGRHWNTQKDYAESAPNYAEREITLNGHDGDNDIAFTRSGGRAVFAKAKFKITDVHNKSEMYPKFGLMVYDGTQRDSGVFFYADAVASKGENVSVDDITGTALGYNGKKAGAWGSWSALADTDGSLDLTKKEVTLAVAYKNGFVYMYLCAPDGDRLVGVTTYKASGNVVIGIKCFGLGLKVTDYYATNDPDSDEVKTHCTRADGVTIGDNDAGYAYTEGWSIIGDTAVNTGTGDQVVYIKGAAQSPVLYAEASVTSPSKIEGSTDVYTKVGAVLKNENYTIFGYIDLEDRTGASERTQTRFAVRYESGEKAGQWVWELGNARRGTTIEDKNVKVGIAKLGATVYLLLDGETVATYTNTDIKDQSFVAGILGMNRRMLVTEGRATINDGDVRKELGMYYTGITLDGKLDDDVWTETVLANKYVFGSNEKTGTRVEVAAVKGKEGVFGAVTMYTRTTQAVFPTAVPWNGVTHVAFRFAEMNDSNKTDANLAQFIAFYRGLEGGIANSYGIVDSYSVTESVTLAGGDAGYKTTVEFFVPYRYFTGYTADSAELPFNVWTCKIDNVDYGGMNRQYKTSAMYVTENGLAIKEK